MSDVSILQEAEELINGERQAAYGNATDSFENIGALWGAYLGIEITSFDVTNLMVLLKVSRTRKLYHRDSYVDIAGYAALAERLHVEMNERVTALLADDDVPSVARVWDDFALIPAGVEVTDAEGDHWEATPNTFGNQYLKARNEQWGPFTEVITEGAPTPRKWKSLDEVPKDVAVFDAGGHYWSFWGPDREDEYGQVIAVGDGEWLWTREHSLEIRVAGQLRTAPFTETDLV